MCLIIDRPAGVEIPKALIDSGLARNPHGWGIMWTSRNTVRAVRGMLPREFKTELKKLKNRALTIHFRLATHGSKVTTNCHPFTFVGTGHAYALMHNGIIDSVSCHEHDRSDSYHFMRYVVGPILQAHPGMFGSSELEALISKLAGSGSKFVLLRSDGKSMRIRESAGVTYKGLWLSNSFCIPAPPLPAPQKLTYFGQHAAEKYVQERCRALRREWQKTIWKNWPESTVSSNPIQPAQPVHPVVIPPAPKPIDDATALRDALAQEEGNRDTPAIPAKRIYSEVNPPLPQDTDAETYFCYADRTTIEHDMRVHPEAFIDMLQSFFGAE